MENEPSVLDYIKAKLMPWKGPAPKIPHDVVPAGLEGQLTESAAPVSPVSTAEEESEVQEQEATVKPEPQVILPAIETPQGETKTGAAITQTERTPEGFLQQEAAPVKIRVPWMALLALLLALIAQRSLEPAPQRSWNTGVILYLLSFGCLVWAFLRKEWLLAEMPASQPGNDSPTFRQSIFLLALPCAFIAFISLDGNKFDALNLILWILAMILTVRALWLGEFLRSDWRDRVQAWLRNPRWQPRLTRWSVLVLAVAAIIAFFHLYRLNQVAPEMTSDHAEKLLDVMDILDGQYSIFFPRNTGREPLYVYLSAWVAKYLGTGISFLTLKISALIGLAIALVYMYYLGKEVANPSVGLLTALFAGIAYWPNVFARFSLRISFYPLFVAPLMYYMFRGFRTSNRNDFILAGLALGFGLMGYSPYRFVPVMVLIAFALVYLHWRKSSGARSATHNNEGSKIIMWLSVLVVVSVVAFLPLLRYWEQNPSMFGFRAFTRLGSLERPLPGPAWQIFLSNLWRAVTMFAWDDGEIWVHSVPHRPALDVISAALFYLGVVLLLLRYIRQRHWADLFIILSVPLLEMPSILSLAFPAENPALNRLAGAIVPVFLIVAIALEGLLSSLKKRLGNSGGYAAWMVGGVLFLGAALQNYDLVFSQYYSNFRASSWNSSEMGAVIRSFGDISGSTDSAWVVPYPHWVDTRLVGITAGAPRRDFAIFPDQLENTLAEPRAKLFLLKPEDQTTMEKLKSLYPQGWAQLYQSKTPTKEFWMFFVPPSTVSLPSPGNAESPALATPDQPQPSNPYPPVP